MSQKQTEYFLNALRAALGLPGVDVDLLYKAYVQFGYRDTSLPVEKIAGIVIGEFVALE